jgi:hypothetical protein
MYRILSTQLSAKKVEEEVRFWWKIVQIFKFVELEQWKGYVTSQVLTSKTNLISQLQHLKSNPPNLRNHKFLNKTKHTIIITTLENGEVCQFQISKFYKKQSQPSTPKSNRPYLPNGEQLRKNKHTMTIKSLKNGGVGHFKILK